MVYTVLMNSWLKIGVAAFIFPGLTAGVLLFVAGMAGVAVSIGLVALLAVLAGLLALSLISGVFSALQRVLRNRLSPVRRKHPRPTAWHQWR